jgi:hypothetical protein
MDLVGTGANAGRAWSPIGHVPAGSQGPAQAQARERKAGCRNEAPRQSLTTGEEGERCPKVQ